MLTKRKTTFYWTHLIVFCAQAGMAFGLLLITPDEGDAPIFFGYYAQKLLLLSIPLVLLILSVLLIHYFRKDPSRLPGLDQNLKEFLKPGVRKLIVFLCFSIVLICFFLIAALNLESYFVLSPAEERLVVPINTYYVGLVFELTRDYIQPLIQIFYLLAGLSTQAIIFVFGVQTDFHAWKKRMKTQGVYTTLWIYGILLILWGLLNWGSKTLPLDLEGYSGIGLAPILERDVFAAVLIGFILIGLGTIGKAIGPGQKNLSVLPGSSRERYLDIGIAALIWITAAALWLSLPLESNWFVYDPAYPNFEFYPRSDAFKYDLTAQRMLLGSELLFYQQNMAKPLYPAFLALLHSLAGPGFENLSLLQSALFGSFPVLVYFLTKRLHSRLAGILASLLVIFREANVIMSATKISVSNSRQLMTDMPAAIGILFVIYIVYIWIEKPDKYFWLPILLGGLISSFIQLRNELLLLLPVILVFQVLIYYQKPRYWIRTSLLLVLGFSVVFSVWQFRTMRFSDESFLNAGRVSNVIRQGQYRAPDPDAAPLEEPEGVLLQKMMGHFVHNQTQAFLIFPTAFRPVDSLIGFAVHRDADLFWHDCCSTENYVDRMRLVWKWQEWDGSIPRQSVPAILITLFLISLGIAKSREKQDIRALFPLLVILAFYLLFSFFRMSGGRRAQIVDWILIIYYSIGLAHFTNWLFYFIFSAKAPGWLMRWGNDNEKSKNQFFEMPGQSPMRWRPVLSAGLVVLVLGAMVPIIEIVIPSRFTEQTKEVNLAAVLNSNHGEDLNAFLENGGAVWEGLAFYPRYVAAGQFDETQGEQGYLNFSLAGPESLGVLMRIDEETGFELKNASHVLVFGCLVDFDYDARAVHVFETDDMIFSDSFPDELVCPDAMNE